MNGDTIQTVVNLFTDVRVRISFSPTLEIPNPIMAAVFIWTSEVGIPLVADEKRSRGAVTIEMSIAPTGPNSILSFPVV